MYLPVHYIHHIIHYRHVLVTTVRVTCSRAGILYYFSSTANPILYNLMSRKFRAAFRHTVCCWVSCGSCWRRTRATGPAAPAPVAFDSAGERRGPPHRPGFAVTPADNADDDERSADDGLSPPTQVLLLRQMLSFGVSCSCAMLPYVTVDVADRLVVLWPDSRLPRCAACIFIGQTDTVQLL